MPFLGLRAKDFFPPRLRFPMLPMLKFFKSLRQPHAPALVVPPPLLAREGVDPDRARGCFLALAVGDALGFPLEFHERDSMPEVRDMVGGGIPNVPPGTWTDDTSQALCLADSLLGDPSFDSKDFLERLVRWWRQGENTALGRCFDIGIGTWAVLREFERSGRQGSDEGPDDLKAGSGSIMRLAPVALAFAPDVDRARRVAAAQSRATHAAPTAADACAFLATLLVEAIGGADKDEVLAPRDFEGRPEIAAIARGAWRGKARSEIRSTGYAVDTLEAAMWCVGTSDTLEDALVLAANLGHDADTVAAVTGQIAGAIWGASSIPRRWLDRVAMLDRLDDCVRGLVEPASIRLS